MKSSINPRNYNGALTAKTKTNHTVFLDFWTNGAKEIWS